MKYHLVKPVGEHRRPFANGPFRTHRVCAVGAVLCGLAAFAFAAEPNEPLQFERVPPTPPEKAEATFRCLHGFSMQLLAAEPLVTDPVALEYDEQGRAWVVEMLDYPYTDKSTDKPNVERTTDAPISRIRILEDVDGDGRFDRSDIFADGLSWATGIALWQGGCYVTATPDVWYLKDTDGDRRADIRRQVFTGFRKLNVQTMINNLRWGLDHKLYAAGASNGGLITKPGDSAFKPVQFGRADFAFDPRRDDDQNGEDFEVLAGGARFGQTFDDWGNRFICNIRNPLQQIVLENRYLARSPFLPVTNAVHDVAEAGDTMPVYRISRPEPFRVARALRYRAETAGMTMPRSELAGEGYFTSACGITLYRGAAYPAEFFNNAFLGEVAGNLIHRQVISPAGVTFKSRRGDDKTEFVASTDNWFRPVNFTNAPDGTLHVCDMYRETIEHPWSIPDDMKAVLDLESGRDRGRIYRLAPPGFTVPMQRPRLDKATAQELVAALENHNSWWRDTAHRLIFERQNADCVAPLKQLLRESTFDVARLHALWSLDGLRALTDADLMIGLNDSSAGVRRQAIRLSEPRWDRSSEIFACTTTLIEDGDPGVRFQLALSLSYCRRPECPGLLAQLLNQAGGDSWIATAALCSCSGRAMDVLLPDDAMTRDTLRITSPELRRQLSLLVGAEGDNTSVKQLLGFIGQSTERDLGLIAGLGQGLRLSKRSLSQFATTDDTKAELQSLFDEAGRRVLEVDYPLEQRVGCVQLLAQGPYAAVKPALLRLLDPKQAAVLQIEAIRGLSRFAREAEVPSLLLSNYKKFSPVVRSEVVEALLSRTDRYGALLDAIDQNIVGLGDIPQVRRGLLLRAKDPVIVQRTQKLLEQSNVARAPVIARYRSVLTMNSDAERGHTVFSRECKTCHRLREEGFDVGPNLATILHRTPDELLTHILDPSREVAPNFLEYVVTLDDGRVLTGLMADETAVAVTLRRAENAQETVLRRNIDEIAASGKSLMPDGLEAKITLQEMADLLAFLQLKR